MCVKCLYQNCKFRIKKRFLLSLDYFFYFNYLYLMHLGQLAKKERMRMKTLAQWCLPAVWHSAKTSLQGTNRSSNMYKIHLHRGNSLLHWAGLKTHKYLQLFNIKNPFYNQTEGFILMIWHEIVVQLQFQVL